MIKKEKKPKFKVGDVVRLKHGDARMTVTYVKTDATYRSGVCVGFSWFDTTYHLQNSACDEDALEFAPDEE